MFENERCLNPDVISVVFCLSSIDMYDGVILIEWKVFAFKIYMV